MADEWLRARDFKDGQTWHAAKAGAIRAVCGASVVSPKLRTALPFEGEGRTCRDCRKRVVSMAEGKR